MVTTLTGISLVAAWAGVTQSEPTRDADVIVVGAGIAGISAALEGAHLGGTILVVDMASVFGGHAVMSEGGLSIVGSPLQRSLRIEDTPDLAYADLDHQWNYPWGLLDPRYPGMSRGLSARNPASIWVNVEGRRFVNETASPKIVVPALVAQQQATYWAIFDEHTKPFLGFRAAIGSISERSNGSSSVTRSL